MAQSAANVLIGAANIYLDDYAAAGVLDVSPTEVGYTKGPCTVAPAFTDYEVVAEQAGAPIKRVPISTAVAVKIPIIESTLEHWQVAFRQPAANLTGDGTATDKVLEVGLAVEQYHQVKLSGPGLGTAGTRDVVVWKGFVTEMSEVGITREGEQMVEMTLAALYDSTVVAAGKLMKVTDAKT